MNPVRRAIEVRGVVQGVGFRPFVARLAAERGLVGEVGNDEVSVFIEVEGSAPLVDDFLSALKAQTPPMAVVFDIAVSERAPRGGNGFRIVPSRRRPGARTLVPPDVATCADCLSELGDPTDRRHRHPFITCTNCGPRFTIITDLPYDRPATTMASFPMCGSCAREYDDPADRRHHAQPISCHDCGPRLWWELAGGAGEPLLGDTDTLATAQRFLSDERIVAVKGIGGFHLACDATSTVAVQQLRERKRRPQKPFAVMARDLDAVRRIAFVPPSAELTLTQPAAPIVLLPIREDGPLAPGIAPGLDEVGVMLPYTPLHHLLLAAVPGRDAPAPTLLVMTSGNLSDEPLCFTNDDARARLSSIADGFLMHDRPIAVPCEDSVVTLGSNGEVPVRRSRGFAPMPVALPSDGPTTLGVGAEIKNTFCVARDELAFCSAHVGDMGSLESQAAFARSVDQLTRLRAASPEVVVADLHPGYATRRWAEDYVERNPETRLVTAQHHHAHLASLLADHGLVGTPVVGVAFDGTGYGCDRQIWGGEVLAIGVDVAECTRMGHLVPLRMPGGDAAVRNPFRIALGLLHGAGLGAVPWAPDEMEEAEVQTVRSQLDAGLGCLDTTSVGRLFDGVASLLGVRHRVTYEAQAAIELEVLARTAARPAELPFPVTSEEVPQLDWRPLVTALVAARDSGTDRAELALGFHRALGAATAALALGIARRANVDRVGLTGGVFANRVLTAEVTGRLRAGGLEVLTHRRVPCNDGGLSLGQVVIGRAMAAREQLLTDRRANGAVPLTAPGREEVD
ncbi:carbamoyltransferase HypF [Nocardioides pelophilus]|uniref:carbamoyltransferase HypF n=1 Tax=Nocardioides pelophilus TaxID=2172019 RepID=UPI0015FF455D|nr:carbamoyltransferase HypF [Nocardioides pelophilus]